VPGLEFNPVWKEKYFSCWFDTACYCIPSGQFVEQDQSENNCNQSSWSGPSQVSRYI